MSRIQLLSLFRLDLLLAPPLPEYLLDRRFDSRSVGVIGELTPALNNKFNLMGSKFSKIRNIGEDKTTSLGKLFSLTVVALYCGNVLMLKLFEYYRLLEGQQEQKLEKWTATYLPLCVNSLPITTLVAVIVNIAGFTEVISVVFCMSLNTSSSGCCFL